MFHRAQAGPLGNSPEMLDSHFGHLAEHYPCVLPGETLQPGLNVCLTFDDGYFDFHRTVVPLLTKHNLKAVLAISPGLILDESSMHPFARLHLPDQETNPHEVASGLCTWVELRELAASNRIAFAAHGMTHARLDEPQADLAREICDPGLLLSVKLMREVDSFVFPFGRYSPLALKTAQKHYRHVFRIGQALNHGWESPMLYRVSADKMTSPAALLTPAKLRGYQARSWWNRLRGR
jgi:peptidoglycan/xylan/chitin deacetylase (PgdA/CDA1 family)